MTDDSSLLGANRAYFRITSETASLLEIVGITGEPPDRGHSVGDIFVRPYMVVKRTRTFSSWERLPSTQSGSVRGDLDDLFESISRIADRISQRDDLTCTLHVVQYFSDSGEDDIGFGLDAPWLSLLAAIPAELDVDQYR